MTLYFYLSVLILAALLFIPVSRMIWVLSVRRLEKRNTHPLTEAQRNGQKGRAQFITLFLVLLFSWLFNQHLLGSAHG